MKDYCLGFAFDHSVYRRACVLLISKKRPEWQAGKLNGVGGKIEGLDENPIDAMTREFYEETGIMTGPGQWRHFLTHTDPTVNRVFVFRTQLEPEIFARAESRTDEEVYPLHVCALPTTCIFNLNWMIPLAFDLNLLREAVVEAT